MASTLPGPRWVAAMVVVQVAARRQQSQGRIFMMREYLGLEADEICKNTGLTRTNLHVILHRARLRLRECLGNGWFNGAA